MALETGQPRLKIQAMVLGRNGHQFGKEDCYCERCNFFDVSNLRQQSKIHLVVLILFSLKRDNVALAVALCHHGERVH